MTSQTSFSKLKEELNARPKLNDSVRIGTTALAINRASGAQTLTGVSIDGNAATATTASATAQTLTRGTYLTGNNFNGSAATTWAVDATEAATASKIVARDGSGDINCRLVRPNFGNESTISGAMAYRVNNSTDNYVRFCSDTGAIRTFLDVPTRGGGNASGTWNINISGSAGSAPITTGSVLSATAAAAVGAVGTYAFLGLDPSQYPWAFDYLPGRTVTGSSLRYANHYQSGQSTGLRNEAPSGTWRLMGNWGHYWDGSYKSGAGNNTRTSVFLRIS